MKQESASKKALRAAFPYTIPIMASFLFLGIAYGFYMRSLGFSFLFPMFMSMTIFGGSLEFVAASLLLGSFGPVQTFFLALMIQARHLFYGVSMLEKYKGLGKRRIYLIFGLCDESFSINYSVTVPEGVDRGRFYFFVTLLNQSYWVIGATLGGVLGSVLKFNTKGIEFIMTAMFVVIFLDQCQKGKQYGPAAIGLIVSTVCLLIFGKDSFLIPSMIGIVACLTFMKKPLSKGDATNDAAAETAAIETAAAGTAVTETAASLKEKEGAK